MPPQPLRKDIRLLASFVIVMVTLGFWIYKEVFTAAGAGTMLSMFVFITMMAATMTLFGTGRVKEAARMVRRVRNGPPGDTDDDDEA